MPQENSLKIGPADERTAAKSLERIFGGVREVDSHLRVRSRLVDEMPREGLLEARRGDRVVGAILSVAQPGKKGLVWLPQVDEDEPPETADLLLKTANEQMALAQISLACAALASPSDGDDHRLRAQGYDIVANVLYLVCDDRAFPPGRPESPLDFEPYGESNHARLARIIEATYEGTQDCPQLSGERDVEDVLAEYRQTGEFRPEHWLLVRHRGEDVGCLIVADHPEHGCCELVYMGLALPARGHGWGRLITQHAQWLTTRVGREQLVVAVDAANDPAISVYASIGFHVWDRRTVYVRLLRKKLGEKS